MRKSATVVLATALVLAVAAGVTGCGSSDGEKSAAEPATAAAMADDLWGTFDPISQSGSGEGVVDLPETASGGIVTASHKGSSNFTIHLLDADDGKLDMLVNEVGDYEGTTFYDDLWGIPARLKIGADGAWTVTVSPVSTAKPMSQSTTGRGDSVLLYDGEAGDWVITHSGESSFMVKVINAEGKRDTIVNHFGQYTGTVPVGAGPAVVAVTADGDWSIEVK